MHLFPAIDLLDSGCVRLKQGSFDAVTQYEKDPLVMARKLVQAGAQWIHIVDLNGAKDGATRQTNLIKEIVAQTGLSIEVGGGIRDKKAIDEMLTAGVKRVVVGSLAVDHPEIVRSWLHAYGGDKIVLAFDIKDADDGTPIVLTRGWQDKSDLSLWDGLELYKDDGLQTILCTDVARDGMQQGSNHALYQSILARYPSIGVLASGGVRDMDDLHDLEALGVEGAIIGKAMYEGVIDIAQALAVFEKR